MKKSLLCLIFSLSGFIVTAQSNQIDSLMNELTKAKEDTNKVLLLDHVVAWWHFENTDSAYKYAREGLRLADSLKFKKGTFFHKLHLGQVAWESGDYPTSIRLAYLLLEEKTNYRFFNYLFYNSYRDMGEPREALKWIDTVNNKSRITFSTVAACYYGLEIYDSALISLKRGINFPYQDGFQGWINLIFAKTYEKLDKPIEAQSYYQSAIKILQEEKNYKDLSGALTSLGRFLLRNGNTDSAIYFGNKALLLSQRGKYQKEEYDVNLLLANSLDKKGNAEEALKFFKLAIEVREKIYGKEKQKQIEGFKFTEELRKKEEQEREEKFKSQQRFYALIGFLIVAVLFMLVLYRNNRQKQKANTVLQKTLSDLKSTQSQLVQSEKMASLGELTAGIAHEIQNPLNFVNNFSEINKELADELMKELEVGNKQSAEELAKDIKDNSEKINLHGKRAGDIVKSMLQHSRKSSGVKEPTDINTLCDEYLRLAYHGLRAKDKSFNAQFQTDFDLTIPKALVISQDIARVVLNLISNAFYAVSEKEKLDGAGDSCQVWVSTKNLGDKIEIRVKDNGTGIPEKIKEKIFQPFFTTKPSGQGTGLGLSLAYDIVTKGHGGTLQVESKEGVGTEFTILLPVK